MGAQGGEARQIFGHFPADNVIVNVGRALMFPNGSYSNVDDWTRAGNHYKTLLNELRS